MPELKTPSVPALERAIQVLELLARARNGSTLPEIAKKLNLPKSSVHCILITLERHGYLHRSEKTARYLLGFRLFAIGNLALGGLNIREVATPILRSLAESTGLTVHLAILERHEAVLIDKIEPPGAAKLATWLGKRMDLHCTGVGKALISHLNDEELAGLVRDRGLARHNENSILSLRKLRDDLAGVRKLGYAVDDEEDEIGLRCIGVPIFANQAAPLAAISIAGTTTQINAENLNCLATKLKNAASAISTALGQLHSVGFRAIEA